MKILLVDDSTKLRTEINRFLQEEDIEISEAENGEQALEKIRQEKFDLLITDYQMPKMNGFELIKHVLADPQLTEMRVILMSTYAAEDLKIPERVGYCDKNELTKLKGMIKKEAQ